MLVAPTNISTHFHDHEKNLTRSHHFHHHFNEFNSFEIYCHHVSHREVGGHKADVNVLFQDMVNHKLKLDNNIPGNSDTNGLCTECA